MYVQLTIELIAKAIKLFCKEEINKKDAKKICKSLAKDDEVEKHYFCGATCTKSKHICMKEVKEEDMQCYVHDPEHKCHGITIKGNKCGSVAGRGGEYCHRHLEQVEPQKKRHVKSEVEAPHTPEYVVDSEEDEESACEDDDPTPHKKKHSKKDKTNKKHSKKHSKKAKQAVSSEEDEESACEEDVAWAKFPHECDDAKCKCDTWLKEEEAPTKKDIIWRVCAFDKAHMYAVNYHLGGNFLFKKYKTDTIVALLWQLPSRDDTAHHCQKYIPKSYKKVLLNMGYTVDELPLDYKPYLNVQGQTEDDVASEDDMASEDESASKDDDPMPRKKKNSKKHSKKDKKKSKSKHSKKHKQVASSEDEHEHESTCEEDEELTKTSPTVVDITSALNVSSLKDAEWAIDASNKNVEYATNFMINGKHIVKLRGKNAYVGLYTPENMLEQEMVYGRESEDEEDIPVEGSADKSKVKWKKFHTGLEYSKSLLVNEDVEYDTLSQKEKEKILTMGFIPGKYSMDSEEQESEEEESEEEPLIRHKATSSSRDDVKDLVVQGAGSRVDDEVQQLDISGAAGLPNDIDWTPAHDQVASKLSNLYEKYNNKEDMQLLNWI
ncbi:hypothetical protein BGZ59_003012, partial [Podila verticillata]